jgi:hypothetical protein
MRFLLVSFCGANLKTGSHLALGVAAEEVIVIPHPLARLHFVSAHGVADIPVHVGKIECCLTPEASDRDAVLGIGGEHEVMGSCAWELELRSWSDIGVGRKILGASEPGRWTLRPGIGIRGSCLGRMSVVARHGAGGQGRECQQQG